MKLREIENRIKDELDEYGLANDEYLYSDDKTDLDIFIGSLRKEWINDTENVYVSLTPLEFPKDLEEVVVRYQLHDIDPVNNRKPWIYLTYDV